MVDFEKLLAGVEDGADGEEYVEVAGVAIGELREDVLNVGAGDGVDGGILVPT